MYAIVLLKANVIPIEGILFGFKSLGNLLELDELQRVKNTRIICRTAPTI